MLPTPRLDDEQIKRLNIAKKHLESIKREAAAGVPIDQDLIEKLEKEMRQILPKIIGQTAVLMLLMGAVARYDAVAQKTSDNDPTKPIASDSEHFFGGQDPALVGTWEVQTTIRNCATGAVMENFSKLASFNKGGTAQESSSSSLFRSGALGIWEQNGGNSFRYLLRFFRFNPDGTPAGSIRAIWYVTQAGNYYGAHASIEVIAPNGAVVAYLCGSERGSKLVFPF